MGKSRYNEFEMARRSIYRRNSRFINLAGSNTFVVEMGKGKSETIILLHGLISSVYTWRGIIGTLSRKYHILALDFMGSGFSEKKRNVNIEAFTGQLRELMKRYSVKEAVLVGNSLGGRIALDFAVRYSEKVKGIVLIDSAAYQKPREKRGMLFKLCRYKAFEPVLKLLITRGRIKRYINSAFYNKSAISTRTVNSYYRPLKTKGAVRSLRSLAKSLSYEEFNFEILKGLKLPALIIWGAKDDWIPENDGEKLHEYIKDSTFVVIENCGHAPQEEYPEKVEELIEGFLKDKVDKTHNKNSKEL